MRVVCAVCQADFLWHKVDGSSLWFFRCPTCTGENINVGLRPYPEPITDPQELLDAILASLVAGQEYYRPEKMRILLR